VAVAGHSHAPLAAVPAPEGGRFEHAPPVGASARVLALQRTAGNRAVARAIASGRLLHRQVETEERRGEEVEGGGTVTESGGEPPAQPAGTAGPLGETGHGGGIVSGPAAGGEIGVDDPEPETVPDDPDTGPADAGQSHNLIPPGETRPLFVGEEYVGDLTKFVNLNPGDIDVILTDELLDELLAEGDDVVLGEEEIAAGEVIVAPEAGATLTAGVAVPVFGLGLLAGAALATTPIWIAYADKVRERLKECGGTLAPGGVERCLENRKCRCRGEELVDGPGVHRIMYGSLNAQAKRWLYKGNPPEVPTTKPDVIRHRRQFLDVLPNDCNYSVLIACPCSGSPLVRVEGYKLLGDDPHGEMNALEKLKQRIGGWPIEERRGGMLGVTAISEVCSACRRRLKNYRQYWMPGGHFHEAPSAGWPKDWKREGGRAYDEEWEDATGMTMPPDWRYR
jgi:hypothetical protein